MTTRNSTPDTMTLRGRHAALAVGLVAALTACSGGPEDDTGSAADKIEITSRSTVVAAHQTYSFDLLIDFKEDTAIDNDRYRPFTQCTGGNCSEADYLASRWCAAAGHEHQPTSIAAIVAQTIGRPTGDFAKYGPEEQRGWTRGRVYAIEPGLAKVQCDLAPAPRYVVPNAERLDGKTWDYGPIDNKTHSFKVPVSRRVAFEVANNRKATEKLSVETQSVDLTITFEPLRAPPTITPKYDELATNGVVKVFVPSLAVCHPVKEAYAFMQLDFAKEDMKQYRASLTGAGYKEVGGDAAESSQTLTNGQGWSLLFEKTVGSGKVEVRVAGPANNLEPARRERVKQWNREASIAFPIRGNYYHPTCTELEGTAPPDRYRVELVEASARQSWEEFDFDILSNNATPPTKAWAPFTPGDRLWFQYDHNGRYVNAMPWPAVDALAAGALGGSRVSANQMITNLAPYLTIELGDR